LIPSSITHSIGGINFFTSFDFSLPPFLEERYRRFKVQGEIPDIQQHFISINSSELSYPYPTLESIERFRKFHFPPFLGAVGAQTIPLQLNSGNNDDIIPLIKASQDGKISFPLLSSKRIWARMEECKNNIEDVSIILHALTIEIRDYSRHQVDIFFINAMRDILMTDIASNGIERLFKIFFSEFNAFPLHCSAMIRKGKVACFLASDEGGKTTVAQKAVKSTILNDDQVVLRRAEKDYKVFSTPWGSINNGPLSCPLGAFFLLEKSDRFEISSCKPRQILEHIWEDHSSYYTDMLPPHNRSRSFDFLSQALHSVPTYKMKFPVNWIDWAAIDKCL
jgi:hypothetical protein